MKNWFNQNGIHLAMVGIFLAICFIYFAPAWQGKVLMQGDVQRAQAAQREIMEFKDQDGMAPLWTNAMFSGMPSYQIWVSYPNNIGTRIMGLFKTVFPNPIDIILIFLIGAYLLFNVLKVKPILAALGAVALTFSSYNFIYIEAGHASKAYALAFFAPLLAGVLLTLRGRYLLGGALSALMMTLEIRVNHIQVTYYLFIAMLILVGIELYHSYKQGTLGKFGKSMGTLAAAAILAIGINAGLLWTTYEYSQESIRGNSNLQTEAKAANTKGLDKNYAYEWSQGVGESITFLIPNAYGGATAPQLDADSKVVKTLTDRGIPSGQALAFAQQIPTYWGNKPFTSGPWYFGAIIMFLFVLGLFIVKGKLKWWLLSATLLSLFLSFGKNFPLISDLFFDYFPLYNKFRAVESTLVIAAFLVPILAVLAVRTLIEEKDAGAGHLKKIKYSVYIVGGVSLLIALLPSLFLGFKAPDHASFIQTLGQQVQDNSFAQAVGNALIEDRMSLARTDALRSLIFIIFAAGMLWLYIKQKLKIVLLFVLLALGILIDMWSVDRRYLNKDNFINPSELKQQTKARDVDELIMRDKALDYRVLDLTSNPFTNASTSLYHNSIGGYHAAKLMRYQELLEHQFNGAFNEDVLDMLNTRYIITGTSADAQKIQKRNTAAGNAWIVDKVTYVKSASEEMRALDSFNPKKEAIVHEEFKDLVDQGTLGAAANSKITLVDYRPDHLVYEYTAPQSVLAVFSEIWYDKGWKAFVDGEEIPYFRADYVLRAAKLPGGNHKVEFKFEPRSYYMGETISLVGSSILVLLLGFALWKNRKSSHKEA